MSDSPAKDASTAKAVDGPASAGSARHQSLQERFDKLTERKPPAPKSFWTLGESAPPEDETLVIKVVQMVIEEGVRARASDIHIEPLENHTRVRFRVDGVLEEVLLIPRTVPIRTVSRIRVMAGLDPEHHVASSKPQDARLTALVDASAFDVRLSTYPSFHGDKVVLRLLKRDTLVPELSQLGLKQTAVDALSALIHRPQGMVIVTGPAGNGKSTTLYTILQDLNRPERNIITIEDPIERTIAGITQSAVRPQVGLSFSEGLRAILRQDPNVIMVGEIRDQETAEIALSAALTGHLLFTTLHTNSALGAVTRLVDMGLEPYLIGSALTALLGQRLARRLCGACRVPHTVAPEEREMLRDLVKQSGGEFPVDKLRSLQSPKGCEKCRGTGYSGRVLLFEMAVLSAPLRRMIRRRASVADLQAAVLDEGMEPMFIDGLQKAAAGITSIDEVVRLATLDH